MNGILRKASALFRAGGARPHTAEMIAFVDAHRATRGAEPIYRALPIAPSKYFAAKVRQRAPQCQPLRSRRDVALSDAIRRIWEENFRVYGARKVCKPLQRDGMPAARRTVERLMRRLGLRGGCGDDPCQGRSLSSRPGAATVRGHAAQPALGGGSHLCRALAWLCLRGLRDRRVLAPDRGLAVCIASANRPSARCIGAGLHDRARQKLAGLIHQWDKGLLVPVDPLHRAAARGPERTFGGQCRGLVTEWAGGIGHRLYKSTWAIRRRGPWKQLEDAEFATLEWVDCFNYRRLLGPLGGPSAG